MSSMAVLLVVGAVIAGYFRSILVVMLVVLFHPNLTEDDW